MSQIEESENVLSQTTVTDRNKFQILTDIVTVCHGCL